MYACSIKELPQQEMIPAMNTAIRINPSNRVSAGKLRQVIELAMSSLTDDPGKATDAVMTPGFIAALTTKVWQGGGVALTVGFLEPTPDDLANRIVSHFNAWGPSGPGKCNVKFTRSTQNPQVRITTKGDGGYYSYLGTDILHIPMNQPTMSLQGFSMQTPEGEFHRVVRHEVGHTLGAPHEHMRAELVARLDVQKTLAYFLQTQGWSTQTTQEQVLKPIDPASIRATTSADQDSIMCYQLPGLITKDGQPIRGGLDIDALDAQFMATIYPLAGTPTNPTGPGPVDPPSPPSGPNIVQVLAELLAAIQAKDLPAVARLLNALIALLIGPAGKAPTVSLKKTRKGRKLCVLSHPFVFKRN